MRPPCQKCAFDGKGEWVRDCEHAPKSPEAALLQLICDYGLAMHELGRAKGRGGTKSARLAEVRALNHLDEIKEQIRPLFYVAERAP